MMCYILSATWQDALRYAATMGLAMQMTNFLRDVGEDWARGRVYLPQDELQRFGVSEAQIANDIVDDRWVALMRFQIDRCRALYADAEQGIPLLPCEAQYPVLLGGRLYARILNAIERNGYDVFLSAPAPRMPKSSRWRRRPTTSGATASPRTALPRACRC
jgi:phytoene synthase